MQTFSTVLERKFVELTEAEIEVLVRQLTTSGGIVSMEDYRRVVGKIEGLSLAKELMVDARKNAENLERGS